MASIMEGNRGGSSSSSSSRILFCGFGKMLACGLGDLVVKESVVVRGAAVRCGAVLTLSPFLSRAGREGRTEFGAKARIKKDKTGGLSNKEKDKRKRLPSRAVGGQVRKRLERGKRRLAKNFKGHVRK